jgi:hypothetical protein
MNEIIRERKVTFDEARRIYQADYQAEFGSEGEPPAATALANEGAVIIEGDSVPLI